MSGVFNPNEPGITATDDEALAKRLGLTEWDDELGQYVAPRDVTEQGDNEDPARVDAELAADPEGPDARSFQQRETVRRDADAAQQRAARDEDPAEHERLAQGLAPGEDPAATESGNAEALAEGDEDDEQDEDGEQSPGAQGQPTS